VEDGEKVYGLIYPELAAQNRVELDFEGVTMYGAPFFNAAIGQLLRDIAYHQVKTSLWAVNMQPIGQEIFDVVIENAHRYFTDEAYRQVWDDIVDEHFAED
jgi:hypothetical protein